MLILIFSVSSFAKGLTLFQTNFISQVGLPISDPNYIGITPEDVVKFVEEGGLETEEAQEALVQALSFDHFVETQKAAYLALSKKSYLYPRALEKLIEITVDNNVDATNAVTTGKDTLPARLLIHFASYDVARNLKNIMDEKQQSEQNKIRRRINLLITEIQYGRIAKSIELKKEIDDLKLDDRRMHRKQRDFLESTLSAIYKNANKMTCMYLF